MSAQLSGHPDFSQLWCGKRRPGLLGLSIPSRQKSTIGLSGPENARLGMYLLRNWLSITSRNSLKILSGPTFGEKPLTRKFVQSPCPSFPWSFWKHQGKPQKHQGFSSPFKPFKSMENKQKTLKKTKEFRNKNTPRKQKHHRKDGQGPSNHRISRQLSCSGRLRLRHLWWPKTRAIRFSETWFL